jgi:transposase
MEHNPVQLYIPKIQYRNTHICIINTILMLLHMKRKTYKFRIYPNRKQETALIYTLNTCRRLYNAAINILNKVGQGLPELTPVEMFLSAKQEAPPERWGSSLVIDLNKSFISDK